MNEAIMPMPPEGSDVPTRVPVTPDALADLDIKGVEQAARKLGLHGFRGDKLVASHTLGKALKRIGALKIGRTILYSAALHAQESIDQCDSIIDSTTDQDLALNALTVKQKFVQAETEAAKGFIKSVEVDGSDDADTVRKVRAFDAGMPAGPVQVIANQAVINNNSEQR